MVGRTNNTEGLCSAGVAIIALGVVLAGLVYGRTFLVPLAISILLWNLLEAMIERFASIRVYEFQVRLGGSQRCWASLPSASVCI
jgi:hypothetical protein